MLAALYITIVLIWGTTWYAMKVSVASFPPLTAAGLRFMFAFPFLLLAVRLVPGWRLLPPAGSRWLVGVLTVGYVAVPYTLINWGEQRTSSGLAAIVFASVTVLLVVMSVLLGTVQVTTAQWGAIAVGLGMLIVLVAESRQDLGVTSVAGPLAIFGAAVLHATSYALIAKYGRAVDIISLEVLPIGVGGALLLGVGTVTEHPDFAGATLRSWLAVGYLAVVASVLGFGLYFFLLQRVSPVLLSFVFIFFPVVALSLAVPLEGVHLTVPMGLAALGALSAFGVAKVAGIRPSNWVDPPASGPGPTSFTLSTEMLGVVCREAIEAFPSECCGFLLKGTVRPARNMADVPSSADEWHRSSREGYVLSLEDARYLDDSLDGDDPVAAVYHSHPNGRAYFSEEDAAYTIHEGRPVYPGVAQLVLGIDETGLREARLFDLDSGVAREVGRWDAQVLRAAVETSARCPDSPPTTVQHVLP